MLATATCWPMKPSRKALGIPTELEVQARLRRWLRYSVDKTSKTALATPATKYPSPCCNAKSIARLISLAQKAMVLRCSRCSQLRIHELGEDAETEQPRLRLVVNH